MRRLLLLAILATSLSAQNVYHEASCPSVDRQRMVRLNRQVAVTSGLAPAADCHPEVRVRYLGVSDPAPSMAGMIHVNGYTRNDGTRVSGYDRRPSDPPKEVAVRGYTRADGTYVEPYMRAAPRNRD
ncbi:MAG TPA: hypothetical protein VGD79_07345 [Thermoanaerobaculia bacterium]|jgi:hypothetical protein